MTMLWQEISWVDVEAYLKNDDRAIVPVGSCEQHGRHLSFATDYLVPVEIGRRVSALTEVPVTPPLCFGMSLHQMEFPGTISFSLSATMSRRSMPGPSEISRDAVAPLSSGMSLGVRPASLPSTRTRAPGGSDITWMTTCCGGSGAGGGAAD